MLKKSNSNKNKNLNILVIDTSTEACIVGIYSDNKIYSRELLNPRQHSKYILEFISELLSDSGLELKDLHVIGFGVGPGSFTGVRIAASVAQALSISNSIPLVGFSSLQALAETAYITKGYSSIIATIDARKAEIYYGIYKKIAVSELLSSVASDSICKPEDIKTKNLDCIGAGQNISAKKDNYSDDKVYIVGTGLNYPDIAIPDINSNLYVREDSILKPSADALVKITKHKYYSGDLSFNLEDAIPAYIRNDVV